MSDSRDSAGILVEIVYAQPERQRLIEVRVPRGTTARDAVLQSGFSGEFAELDLMHCPIGIFGKQIADQTVLTEGDRVEIYRPLQHDPREARRAAAASGKSLGSGSRV